MSCRDKEKIPFLGSEYEYSKIYFIFEIDLIVKHFYKY
jgi:hypothetical protein